METYIERCDIHPFNHRRNYEFLNSTINNQYDEISLLIGQSSLSLFSDKTLPPNYREITSLYLTILRTLLCLRSEAISIFFIIFFLINLILQRSKEIYQNLIRKFSLNYNEKSMKKYNDKDDYDDHDHDYYNDDENYIVKHTTTFKIKNILLLIMICVNLSELFISGFYFYRFLSRCENVSFMYFFNHFFYSSIFQFIRIFALVSPFF